MSEQKIEGSRMSNLAEENHSREKSVDEYRSPPRVEVWFVGFEQFKKEFQATGETVFNRQLKSLLCDRQRGNVLLHFVDGIINENRLRRFSHRLAKSIGEILPETRNTDGQSMPSADSVEISLTFKNEYKPELRHFENPQECWPLHTDRVLHEDPGDFLMVAKLSECNGSGGAIRLLHMDDWEERDRFINHPFAHLLEWKGDFNLADPWKIGSLRKLPGYWLQYSVNIPLCGSTIRFSDDRFRIPKSKDQAIFLTELSESLTHAASQVRSFFMPVGSIYIVNNRFMLHGRAGSNRTRILASLTQNLRKSI
ncbi:MAG: carbon starvation induced protein CsiD [Pirellulaceae bacterium]